MSTVFRGWAKAYVFLPETRFSLDGLYCGVRSREILATLNGVLRYSATIVAAAPRSTMDAGRGLELAVQKGFEMTDFVRASKGGAN